jgi:beta-N-acetylhexosaminidase
MARSSQPRPRDGGGAFLVVGTSGIGLTAEERRILAELRPYGVILFRRNVENAGQLLALTGEIRAAAPGTLLFVDAEGGRVDRLAPIAGPAPSGADLAAAAPDLSVRAGRWVGHALRALGFDADFAPVVDLDRGIAGNGFEGRLLGRRPRAVIARARAFLAGLRSAGAGGCIKHFPGMGGTGEDTHHRGTRVTLTAADLLADLAPFAALGAEAGAVMIGHAVYPALDPEELPADLSPAIIGGLLRRDLGFDGVAFSDDLEMRALGPHGTLAERAGLAFAAGCDAILICSRLDAAPAAAELLARAEPARRAESARRLAAYRDGILSSRRGVPGYRLESVRDRLARVRQEAQRALA